MSSARAWLGEYNDCSQPSAVCGDFNLDPGEDCDPSYECCIGCHFNAPGTTCTDDANPCTISGCTGAPIGACDPLYSFEPLGTSCPTTPPNDANQCDGAGGCVCKATETPKELSCSDGKDNDCDGLFDNADLDCILLGWWKLDDGGQSTTPVDSAGSNNGLFISTPAWVAGKSGSALSFDGVDDCVRVNDIDLSAGNTMTLAAWVKPDDIHTLPYREIFRQGTISPPDWLIAFQESGTVLSFGLNAGGSYTDPELDATITPSCYEAALTGNKWIHIAATYDGSTMKLYRNGFLLKSQAKTGAIRDACTYAYIGCDNGNTEEYDGAIDDVRVYNTALSQSDIAALVGTPASFTSTVTQANGDVTLNTPFALNAEVACTADDCGSVVLSITDTDNAFSGDGDYSCGLMSAGSTCHAAWSLTPTGALGPHGITVTAASQCLGSVSSARTFTITPPAQPDWWDTDWAYRVPITITNTGGALTNYQALIQLTSSFDYAKAKADGADIRVIADDHVTAIPFWIEGWNVGGTTNIWVKTSLGASSEKTVYVYYGNAAATSASNGNNVFLLFDDFSGGSLDGAKWTNTGATTVTVGSGMASLAYKDLPIPGNAWGKPAITSVQTFNDYVLDTVVKHDTDTGLGNINYWLIDTTHYYAIQHDLRTLIQQENFDFVYRVTAGNTRDVDMGSLFDNSHMLEWAPNELARYSLKVSGTAVTFDRDSLTGGTGNSGTFDYNGKGFATTGRKIGFSGDNRLGNFYVDWASVRLPGAFGDLGGRGVVNYRP